MILKIMRRKFMMKRRDGMPGRRPSGQSVLGYLHEHIIFRRHFSTLGFRMHSLTKLVPVLAQSAEFRLCKNAYNFYIHKKYTRFLLSRNRLSWHACVQPKDP